VGSADRWLSSGDATTDFLVHYGAAREKCIKYPFSSLDAEDILPAPVSPEEKQNLRRELGMECDNMILSIGQFIPRKGFDILLRSAAKLKGKADIFIVGGEPTEEYLKLRSDLGLTNVHFVGFMKKEKLAEVYRAADLFVLPTREDIWGLVVGEAMAYGLPVITTDRCVAGLELVEEGVSGYIVPVEDVEQLAEKMDAVLSGPMEAMGAAALERIRPYTIENMARGHAKVFEDRS
jgi:glycosyltransferase involved in cell wall biosynthesis